jgi:hypothetical protein
VIQKVYLSALICKRVLIRATAFKNIKTKTVHELHELVLIRVIRGENIFFIGVNFECSCYGVLMEIFFFSSFGLICMLNTECNEEFISTFSDNF